MMCSSAQPLQGVFGFLGQVAALVLKTDDEGKQGLNVDSITPGHGGPGTLVIIHGSGFDNGTTATFGAVELEDATVGPTGQTIAGHAPKGPSGAVDATVTRSDGTAKTVKRGFVYE